MSKEVEEAIKALKEYLEWLRMILKESPEEAINAMNIILAGLERLQRENEELEEFANFKIKNTEELTKQNNKLLDELKEKDKIIDLMANEMCQEKVFNGIELIQKINTDKVQATKIKFENLAKEDK